MRMWMVPPQKMCRKHLLGEHVEIHMAVASLRHGKSLAGFLRKGLLELASLERRHDELVHEMLRRGYSHRSPLGRLRVGAAGKVNRSKSAAELTARCSECRQLFRNHQKSRLFGRDSVL